MKKFLRAFAVVTTLSTVTRLVSFVFKIYLSRSLGAEILGLYQITMSVMMLFAALSASGLPVTLSRLTAEGEALCGKDKMHGAFTSAMLCALMLAATVITFFIAFPSVLYRLFSDPRCVRLFVVMLPMLITTSVYAIVRGWFWGKKEFLIFSVSELLEELLKILIAVALLSCALFGISKLYAYAIAMLVTDILAAIGLTVCFFVKGGKLARPARGKEMIRSAAPLTVTRVFGSLLSTFLSLAIPALLVKSGMEASQATAEFGRAGGMVMPLILTPTSVIGSLGVVLIPEIASFHASGKHEALSGKIGKSLQFACVVCGMFFVLFGSMGDRIAARLYHDDLAGVYLRNCACLMLPIGINALVISMLNSLGKETQTFASHIGSSIALVAIAVWTPRVLGIYAYFVALIVFHTLSLTVNLILLARYVPLQRKQNLQNLATLILCAVLCFAMRPAFEFSVRYLGDWGAICLCSAVALTIFALILSWTGVVRFRDLYAKARPYLKLPALPRRKAKSMR